LISNGARPLKRAIQKYVEDSLAEIITSKISIGDEIFYGLKKGSRAKCKVHKPKSQLSNRIHISFNKVNPLHFL
jgi:ATP-dependent Clp protease ATP-binding subunit ClpA